MATTRVTIVVTRNSPGRVRGFLASCMCEIAPGVYTAPRMTVAVRERIWNLLTDWYTPDPEHSILMTWPQSSLPGGQEVRVLGIPQQDVWRHDGVYVARREVDEKTLARLRDDGGEDLGPSPDAA